MIIKARIFLAKPMTMHPTLSDCYREARIPALGRPELDARFLGMTGLH